ncbi:DarT ssDNA thymidine ADP-ribosyltransferase family protein [Mesorhizobium sp. ISC11]|uniref:DarT ssDNA thymidine ADP-ribosyltransferase family protein n=1 Tax=Mesorhizobium sp. ISC11 TaxID=3076428 RepID=UPI00301D9D9D
MPTIPEIVNERGIREVLHFTTNLGLTGCLHSGKLFARSHLKKEENLKSILTLNAPFRSEEEDWFDQTVKWIDYVNLSISEITTNLFKHSLKWHAGRDLYWIILSFDPEILAHDGVYFSTTNNIYDLTVRGLGPKGLLALFDDVVPRKRHNGWKAYRGRRAAHLSTCEQAEVLYPDAVPMEYLRRVYVRQGEEADRVAAVLGNFGRADVEVIVDEAKFRGNPN